MLHVNNILLATDFSIGARQAFSEALLLARRHEATLHVLHVVTAPARLPMAMDLVLSSYKEEAFGDLEAQAASQLEELLQEYDSTEVPIETAVQRGEAAGPVILSYAEAMDTDLVALGTRGQRKAKRLFMGSVAEEVIREAACPVLAVREHGGSSPPDHPVVERILLPVDFSEHSQRAMSYGKELAASYGADLDLLHVIERPSLPGAYGLEMEPAQVEVSDVSDKVRKALMDLSREAPGPDVPTELHVHEGHASNAIISVAKTRGSDLIVLASHGRTGLKRFVMGSTAESVLREAPCPAFIVKSYGKLLLPDHTPEAPAS